MTEVLKSNGDCKGWTERLMLKTGVPQSHVEVFYKHWSIVELGVFGPMLRDDFGPDSDIDLLFQFGPDSTYSFQDLPDMEDKLEGMFSRKVVFDDRNTIENGKNPLRRLLIFEAMKAIHKKEQVNLKKEPAQ